MKISKEVKELHNEKPLNKKKKTKKEMREDTFTGCHNKQFRSGHSNKRVLQIQSNPHQNYNDMLHRTRKINPSMYMEEKRTINS